jgi:hypothetical protein
MKSPNVILMIAFVVLLAPGSAAGGPFGPPQPIVKEAGGLHTGIGYWFHEDKYVNNMELVTRQNQVYSELGYGFGTGWEVTARIGRSDLNAVDAFSPSTGSTATSKSDFEENGKFFGTVGTKGFYPVSQRFGMGAFVQGTYYFSDLTDTVSGTRNGIPFSAGLRIKNLWDVNFGLSLQVTIPQDIKIYIGTYFQYSELKVSPSENVVGLTLATGETILRNNNGLGGFAGIEVPLAKGFRLNLEGQFTERPSAGVAVIYVY